jgi:hypothetical protein
MMSGAASSGSERTYSIQPRQSFSIPWIFN